MSEKNEKSEVSGPVSEEQKEEHKKQVSNAQKFHDAEIEFVKEKTLYYKNLNKSIPILVEKAEIFLDTKSKDIVAGLKTELMGQMNFLVVKALFDAGMVDREALDAVAFQSQTVYGPQEPQVKDAASEVMGNFTRPPAGIM